MTKTRWIGVLLAIAVVGGGAWIMYGPQPSDQEEIDEALQNSVKASREGRPGGLVEYLSDSFNVNGTSYDVTRQVSEAIKKYHPDASLTSTTAKINGRHATVTTDVILRILKSSLSIKHVTFSLSEEMSTKWLLFPSKTWKLEGASVPPEAIPEVLAQLPGLGG